MTAAAAVDDAWLETCKIVITAIGGSDLNAAGVTETIDIDPGSKDLQGIPLVNGGRVMKYMAQEDAQFTIEAYPLQAGTDSGTTLLGFWDLMNTVDSSIPIRVVSDRTRKKCRILVLWTNDTGNTGAAAVTNATYSAYRIGAADGLFTSIKSAFTDGILKFTCIYKTPTFDKAAAANFMEESAGGGTSDTLPAIAAYTVSNKFS